MTAITRIAKAFALLFVGPISTSIFAAVAETADSPSPFRRFVHLSAPPVVAASKDLDLGDYDTPLVVTGLVSNTFSLNTVASVVEEYAGKDVGSTPIRIDVTPLSHSEVPTKLSNGTLISPAQLAVPFGRVLPLLRTRPEDRGFNAYVRLLDLRSHPGLSSGLPLARALHLAGPRLVSANLWLGDGSIRSAVHYDGQDNILLQLSGRKTVLLIPPELEPRMQYQERGESRFIFEEATGKFADGSLKPTGRTVENHGLFDPFSDDESHEISLLHPSSSLDGTRAMLCTLRPGEALFLPALWAHAVVSSTGSDLNAAVNLWFVQRSVSHLSAMSRHPSWAAGQFILGNDLLAQNRHAEAETAFRRSLEIRPSYFDAAHNLASALEGEEDRIGAKKQYQEAFTLSRSVEEGVRCLCNIGVIAKRDGDLEEAEDALKEALDLDPQSGRAWRLLGHILALRDELVEAEHALGTAVRILAPLRGSDTIAALNSWGVVLEQLDRKNDAVAAYKQALDIDPSFQKARNSLDSLLGRPEL